MNEIHPFEKTGLGIAPFVFRGMSEKVYQACPGAPIQAAGTCDHCGMGIRYCCHIESSDGKRFVVGTSCVMKLNRADNRWISEVEREKKVIEAKQRRAKKEAKEAPEKARIEAAKALLENNAVRAKLASNPHPSIEGKTELDYVDYLWRWAGHSGLLRMAKIIEDAAN